MSRRSLLLLGAATTPTLDLNFVDGSPFDGRITFTRASGATYFDATGTLQTAASNAPRIDYNPSTLAVNGLLIEEQRTNGIRNPRCEGAVAGTPGTLPTTWLLGIGNGLSQQIVGTGTESGIPYVDIRYFGTTTAAGVINQTTEGSTSIAASNGQVWTHSVFLRLVGGSLANISSITLDVSARDSGGAALVDYNSSAITISSAPLASQRFRTTATMSSASTAFIQAKTLQIFYPISVAIDITIRIGAPQLELGAFATSPILPAVGAPAATTRAGEGGVLLVSSASFDTGSLAAEYQTVHGNAVASEYAAQLSDGTDSNRYAARIDTTGTQTPQSVVVSGGGGAQVSTAGAANTAGVPAKLAAAWRSASVTTVAAGNLLSVGAITTPVGTPTTMTIGCATGNASQANAYVRRARYWPRALSTSELQTVTT